LQLKKQFLLNPPPKSPFVYILYKGAFFREKQNMKLKHSLIFSFCISAAVIFGGWTPFWHRPSFDQLHALLADIKLYRLASTPTMHTGDLWQHSMNTHFACRRLLASHWYAAKKGRFNERQQELLELAALLHDIGKAGQPDLFNPKHKRAYRVEQGPDGNVAHINYVCDHQEHVLAGFRYIAAPFLHAGNTSHAPLHYRCADGTQFDFDKLFRQLRITSEERKFIAIMVAMHWEFGLINQGKKTAGDYVELLKHYVDAINYNHGNITPKLVYATLVIQASDVLGITPVKPLDTMLFRDTPIIPANRKVPPFMPAIRFGYVNDKNLCYDHHAQVVQKIKEIMAYYYKHHKPNYVRTMKERIRVRIHPPMRA
jgi:hypothetical protein